MTHPHDQAPAPMTADALAETITKLRQVGRYAIGGNTANAAADLIAAMLSENTALAAQLAERDAELARVTAECDMRRQNMRDTWQAMQTMRNAINEYIPLPSMESDLLQGPENSVFCEVVATNVIARIAALTEALMKADAHIRSGSDYDYPLLDDIAAALTTDKGAAS